MLLGLPLWRDAEPARLPEQALVAATWRRRCLNRSPKGGLEQFRLYLQRRKKPGFSLIAKRFFKLSG